MATRDPNGERRISRPPHRRDEIVIPVAEERLVLGKRKRVTARVRIHKTVESREVELVDETSREVLEVERVSIGQYVERLPRTRVDGDLTIVPVVEEVVVLQKRLLLREELRIRKRRTVTPRRLRVPVRREQIAVERSNESSSDHEQVEQVPRRRA